VIGPLVAPVCKRERRGSVVGKPSTTAVHYGITRIAAQVAAAARRLAVVRAPWRIENGVHQRRDGPREEAARRVRSGNAPHLLASLKNLTLGISVPAGWDKLAAAQRAFAYQIDKALAQPR
jgi:hypothetical protein